MTEPKKTLTQRVITMLTGVETGIEPATRTKSGLRRKVTAPEQDPKERRQYRRIAAQVYCRAAGLRVFSKNDGSIDVSRGGVRVYSDEHLAVGDRLTMELFLKDQPSVTFDAEVAWIEPLEAGEPGKFDVGLKFLHLSPANEALLAAVLE